MKRKKSLIGWGIVLCCIVAIVWLTASAVRRPAEKDPENHVVISIGKKITLLDPALAADFPTQSLCAAFYDTLVQYAYDVKDYSLEPSMLEKMPELQPDGKLFCTLRKDLYFQNVPPLDRLPKAERKVTSRDVAFSLMRLADARLNSPGFWVVRDVLKGMTELNRETAKLPPDDMSVYDRPCEGIEIVDEFHFRLVLTKKNPRFLNLLALPSCAIVSKKAADLAGNSVFAEHPCGSGPFLLADWNKDYSITMDRNPEYRQETFSGAEREADRTKNLPLADRITCYLVRQGVSSWFMFLQGELDYYALDGEQFQAMVGADMQLAKALRDRGISLLWKNQFETNYIGFNFNDPILGKNADLRRAISLAFDKKLRVLESGGRFIEAYGPVPPGLPGAMKQNDFGPYGQKDVNRAKALLAKAGYPGGIDPATGKPLVISFDQAGSDSFYQQTAELMANDLRAIGIECKANLNTRPRFNAKIVAGDVQMFRYSWIADYPDAENFLLLFYSGNAGGSNRTNFRDKVYDKMYEEAASMMPGPERTAKYEAMVQYLNERCPWICETHTMDFVVRHSWMKNYRLHDFVSNRWKYLSVSAEEREKLRRSFKPLPMSDMR